MLGWAYRCLAMVILIGVGVGMVADLEIWRFARGSGSAADADPARHFPSESEAAEPDEDETWGGNDDEAWEDEADENDSYQDEAYEDDGYEDESYDDGSYEDESSAAPLEMIIPASAHGHFLVEAVVEGTPLAFVIDTGASDVVLSPADAERLGFRPDELRFTRRYQTANGVVAAAPVTLRASHRAVQRLRRRGLGQRRPASGLAARHELPAPAARLSGRRRPPDPSLVGNGLCWAQRLPGRCCRPRCSHVASRDKHIVDRGIAPWT